MSKITLGTILSGFRSALGLNNNFDAIQAAFDNTLSRDGTAPNYMSAQLDMNNNRIINLAKPVSMSDAVRLQDLVDASGDGLTVGGGGSGGGSGGPVSWDDVTDKPSTFAPDPEATQDIVAAELIAGSGISVSYNDTAGKVTITNTAPAGGTSVDDFITNGVVDRAPSQNAVYDALALKADASSVTGLVVDSIADADTTHAPSRNAVFDALALKLNSSAVSSTVTSGDTTHVPTSAAVYSAISGAGGGSTIMPNFVTAYGGVGDGITNNDAALAAALAQTTYERIWLPEGTYLHTNTTATLTAKRFEGPGMLKKTTNVFLRNFAGLNTQVGSNTTSPYGTDLPSKFATNEYRIIKQNTRVGLDPSSSYTQGYFSAPATPHFAEFVVQSGGSGLRAHIPSGVSAGATSVTVNDASFFTSGMKIGFGNNNNGPWLDTPTVSSVVGNTITFSPALSNSYPVNPAISAEGPVISEASRTMNPYQLIILNHQAPGDAYAHCARVICEYAGTPGQTHMYDRSTGGLYGGDLQLVGQGNYGTGIEIMFTDGGAGANNGGIVGDVRTYERSNDTDQYGVFWIDRFVQSIGTKPVDAGYVMAGQYRTGIDVARADFSSNDQAAIQLSKNQRIYFDSVSNAASRGRGIYTNVPGDTFMRVFDNAGQPTWEIARRDDLARWRMSQSGGVGTHNVKGNLNVNGVLNTNSTLFTTGGGTGGGRLAFNNSGVWLEWSGSNLRFTNNGGASYTNLA